MIFFDILLYVCIGIGFVMVFGNRLHIKSGSDEVVAYVVLWPLVILIWLTHNFWKNLAILLKVRT